MADQTCNAGAVVDDEAVEAPLGWEIGDDAFVGRHGNSVESTEADHDRLRVRFFYGGFEWRELGFVKIEFGDGGWVVVFASFGGRVANEMLGGGDDAVAQVRLVGARRLVLQAFDESNA